jgi:uncharacterized protein (UPF0254 family)
MLCSIRVSWRKRFASSLVLLAFLTIKLSLSFPIISNSRGVDVSLHHHSHGCQEDAEKSSSTRKNTQPAAIISSIVAIPIIFASSDPASCALLNNDSIESTTLVLNTKPPSSTVYYRSPSKQILDWPAMTRSSSSSSITSPSIMKNVIAEENNLRAAQMKSVVDVDREDSNNSQSIVTVTEEEDERIMQQMKEVGITTRIDANVGVETVSDVREKGQRLQQQQQQQQQQQKQQLSQQTAKHDQQTKKGVSNSIKGSEQGTNKQQKQRTQTSASSPASSSGSSEVTELQTSDIKKITDENKIEVVLIEKSSSIKIDRENFTKVRIQTPAFLRYLPSSVQPLVSSFKVLKQIPDDQLFIASVLAGSVTEVIRTTLLYPLSTIKARVQARSLRSTNRKRKLLRKLKVTWLTFVYETKRGELYAGILPSLLITVPASGVYAGTKEVSRRAFTMAIPFVENLLPHGENNATVVYSTLVVSLLAAFVADIVSLALRTPADVLSLRLQVFGDKNVNSDLSSWARDSFALLPSMILCDIPYLLSRIFLNAAITTSSDNLSKYEVETVAVACLCAFLTTPFDVARTRILLPTMPSDEERDGSIKPLRRLIAPSKYREERRQQVSVPLTMKRIAAEGNGGLQNLYAGWGLRTVFTGLGRGWFDPIRLIGYLGLRDAILLKLFD